MELFAVTPTTEIFEFERAGFGKTVTSSATPYPFTVLICE